MHLKLLFHTVSISCFVLLNLGHAASFDDEKNAGNDFFKAEKYEEAYTKYVRALTLAPDNSKRAIIHFNMAQCYRLQGQIGLAVNNLNLAINYDPKYEKALYWFLQLNIAHRDNFDSRQYLTSIASVFDNALKAFPQNDDFRRLLAHKQMLENGSWVAPGVAYLPDFLPAEHAATLSEIYKSPRWKDQGTVYSEFDFGPDWSKFEKVLGEIFRDLARLKLLPENVVEFGFINLRYEKGGSLAHHKDHKMRSDHFVLGISIGGACEFSFIRDRDGAKTALKLAPNSLYVTKGEFHDICTHGIDRVTEKRYALIIYVPSPNDTSIRFNIQTEKLVSKW